MRLRKKVNWDSMDLACAQEGKIRSSKSGSTSTAAIGRILMMRTPSIIRLMRFGGLVNVRTVEISAGVIFCKDSTAAFIAGSAAASSASTISKSRATCFVWRAMSLRSSKMLACARVESAPPWCVPLTVTCLLLFGFLGATGDVVQQVLQFSIFSCENLFFRLMWKRMVNARTTQRTCQHTCSSVPRSLTSWVASSMHESPPDKR